MSINKLLATIISLAVLAAIIIGLILAGSPAAERTRRTDSQRVEDLQSISYAVQTYAQTHNKLPASLEEAARQPDAYVTRITDPETNQPYQYIPGDEKAYQLCATFDTPSEQTGDPRTTPPELSFWAHGAGETCYTLHAEEEDALKPVIIR